MRLATKYAPKRLVEVVGQPEAVSQMLLWLSGWKKGRPLIVHGPTGTGKTAAVHALAAERGFELIELGNEDSEIERVLPAIKQHSLTRKQKLVVVEDAEHLPARMLTSIVKESVFPVILFVDDVWKPRFAALRYASEVIQFRKVLTSSIEKRLKEVGRLEQLPENVQFRSFAEAAAGDVRAALIDMDSGSDAARDRATNVFDAVKTIFKGTAAEAAKAIERCDKDPNQLMWWIEENIPNEFSDPTERAAAFELLSKADLRRKRCPDLLSCFSSVRKSKTKAYTAYRPPKFMPVPRDDETCLRLAEKMHCSPSKARKEMEFLKPVLK
jgi:replication factor C large subunit